MIIKAKVFVNSKIFKIEKIFENEQEIHLVIRVRVVPENGKANLVIMQSIAEFLQLPKSSIILIKGKRCRNKIFRVNK